MSAVFPSERIEQTILLLRGHKIILDRDLAAMYGVSTRDLNKAVSRNLDRFPDDFMLQLTRSGANARIPHAIAAQRISIRNRIARGQLYDTSVTGGEERKDSRENVRSHFHLVPARSQEDKKRGR